MREAKRTLREIQRLQTEARARHADPDATDTAERIEHVTMVMTAEAVERLPEPAPEPYVPQRAAPKVYVAKTDPKSHETKTETPPRQPEASPRKRRPPRPARPGSVRPRGPGWDRPMFFPDKPAKALQSEETAAAEAPPRTAPTAGK